jgi:hypothetical protein
LLALAAGAVIAIILVFQLTATTSTAAPSLGLFHQHESLLTDRFVSFRFEQLLAVRPDTKWT